MRALLKGEDGRPLCRWASLASRPDTVYGLTGAWLDGDGRMRPALTCDCAYQRRYTPPCPHPGNTLGIVQTCGYGT